MIWALICLALLVAAWVWPKKPKQEDEIEEVETKKPSGFNDGDMRRDHVLLFRKDGEFEGVRAVGHDEAGHHDRFDIYWPNGDRV